MYYLLRKCSQTDRQEIKFIRFWAAGEMTDRYWLFKFTKSLKLEFENFIQGYTRTQKSYTYVVSSHEAFYFTTKNRHSYTRVKKFQPHCWENSRFSNKFGFATYKKYHPNMRANENRDVKIYLNYKVGINSRLRDRCGKYAINEGKIWGARRSRAT